MKCYEGIDFKKDADTWLGLDTRPPMSLFTSKAVTSWSSSPYRTCRQRQPASGAASPTSAPRGGRPGASAGWTLHSPSGCGGRGTCKGVARMQLALRSAAQLETLRTASKNDQEPLRPARHSCLTCGLSVLLTLIGLAVFYCISRCLTSFILPYLIYPSD